MGGVHSVSCMSVALSDVQGTVMNPSSHAFADKDSCACCNVYLRVQSRVVKWKSWHRRRRR